MSQQKILALEDLLAQRARLRQENKRTVFTNGCFDLLHPGHIDYLSRARRMGDALIVGVNSDRSVRELKGPLRPILTQDERTRLLSGLDSVDYLTVFDEDTPHRLIAALLPDVLVKGGDWTVETIVGRQEVEAAGGRVVPLPYLEGQSSTAIIERILHRYGRKA
ncbi:MAG: D-glycero-beta-D-manno-heptose 1-phosphate adenylyltransferase [Acidobacteria bacterium]|nr:D-glycero-beta-D-manno-heptose 1-phosphate adenylyltransferase [Acidobacteriota bacterium]